MHGKSAYFPLRHCCPSHIFSILWCILKSPGTCPLHASIGFLGIRLSLQFSHLAKRLKCARADTCYQRCMLDLLSPMKSVDTTYIVFILINYPKLPLSFPRLLLLDSNFDLVIGTVNMISWNSELRPFH